MREKRPNLNLATHECIFRLVLNDCLDAGNNYNIHPMVKKFSVVLSLTAYAATQFLVVPVRKFSIVLTPYLRLE